MTEEHICQGFRFPASCDVLTGPSDTPERRFSSSYTRDSYVDADGTQEDSSLVEILPRAGGTVSLSATLSGGRSHSWFPNGSIDQTGVATNAARRDTDNSMNNSNIKSKRLKEVQNTSIFNSSVSLPSQQSKNFVAGYRDGQNSTPSVSPGSPREDEEPKAMNTDASINPRMRASAIRRRTQNKQVRASRNMTPHSGRTTPVTHSATHLTAYRGSGIQEALTNLEDQDQVVMQASHRASLAPPTSQPLSPRASVSERPRSYSESIGVSSPEMARYFALYQTPGDKVRQSSLPSTSDVSCTRSPQVNEITQSQIPAVVDPKVTNVGALRNKPAEVELEDQVSDLQKRVSLLEGQNRSLHVQNQQNELRLEELEKKIALLMSDSNRRAGTTSTSPSPPRVPDALGSENVPTRAPSKAATTVTTYTRV